MAELSKEELIQQKLDKLKADYYAHLPDEIDQLIALTKKLKNEESSREKFHELHVRLHKITGSAGTFGSNNLSAHARKLERKVKNWLQDPLSEITRDEIKLFITTIKQLKKDLNNELNHVNKHKFSLVPSNTGPAPSKTYNIWIVDDDTFLVDELSYQIESFGYKTRKFNKLSALKLALKSNEPDLILLDVIFENDEKSTDLISLMPELNSSRSPIIFMSSTDEFDTRIKAAQIGAQGFFIKPLDVPSLINRVVQLFERKRAPAKRVLIVDDDKRLAEHYRLVFESANIEAEILENPTEIINKVNQFRPELILMDLYMPDYFGPDLAGVVRQYENWASLPIVFLSSETDLDKQIDAMQYGADDFLTKPISDSQLLSAVRSRINRARQLEALISRDSLTGLLKHSSIKDAVENEISRAQRNQSSVSVAMLDIDSFKQVNDTYGHATGDVVICAIAMLLRQRLRQYDIIGRYGGEEFVIILPECSLQQTLQILDDVRQRFSTVKFRHQDSEFCCTISIGFAMNTDFPGRNGSELLIQADNALYYAKRTGRNQTINAHQLTEMSESYE
ncbi:diguanylate cyclase [Aliikangiella maris]|uniref:diguanylate cyclase n=2 Tax=Aliikangiella maris TaxID=3162458 RepID=A0ABV2BWW5_9GAMM